MSARDELAELFNRHGEYSTHEGLADIAIAAGYSKPRTITTEAELEALPVGSVVRTSGTDFHALPRVAVKTGFWHGKSEWQVADSDEWDVDSSELDDLPATVLYTHTPEES